MSTPGAQRFSGLAGPYDRNRPAPPVEVVDLLCRECGRERPGLVVDLGCGTGLSTRIWLGRADRVIGVEPSDDMRRQAQAATAELLARQDAGGTPRGTGVSPVSEGLPCRMTLGQGADTCAIEFRPGFGQATGLEVSCADVVTCSQSLHWMEPGPTFREIGRILRAGGVFAAIDCDWPPAMPVKQAEQAWKRFMEGTRELEKRHGIFQRTPRWDKSQHLHRMRDSGVFASLREVVLASRQRGDGPRLAGLAESFGGVGELRKAGLSDQQIDLTDFARQAVELLGTSPQDWLFTYRVRLGIRGTTFLPQRHEVQ